MNEPWNTTLRPDVFLFEETAEEEKTAFTALYHPFLSATPLQFVLLDQKKREQVRKPVWRIKSFVALA